MLWRLHGHGAPNAPSLMSPELDIGGAAMKSFLAVWTLHPILVDTIIFDDAIMRISRIK